MAHFLLSLAASSLLVKSTLSAPSSAAVSSSIVASGLSSAAPAFETVALASDDANDILWFADTPNNPDPQAIRGSLGATVLGPANIPIDQQNADFLAPPSTDAGSIKNAKWPFSLSHNRLQTGGWARQQNQDVMPIAGSMAGVNMRLDAGAIRELHWHSTAEWAYGTVQVTAVTDKGQNFLGNVGPGDLWYFPPGIPHSLQATADLPDGAEFLLVFDDGAFSEDSTFLLTDWLSHVPKDVIAKNFQTSPSAFNHIPAQQLYIFPSVPIFVRIYIYICISRLCGAAPPADNLQAPVSPQGTVSNPFIFPLSQVNATQFSGGTFKVVDESTFTASTAISAAEVSVEPGAMRELHWHPTQDEWTFYLGGSARVTLFGSSGNARTFDFQAGDVGFVPASFGHYVENIGNTTLHFLEIFNSGRVQDISLSQWLALTPPELVKAHLDLSDETIAHLSKTKPVIVGSGSQ
ncbi:oxalate decarboxylase [Epithele typhae]|uniref:oxalate decarboxylase n=1 Tax=Epithele typhae TaxID=378194 RepID=UPI002008E16A|nr:oxalate decarboxylase [Epithele typhae]KAH9945408.1 oxalate decarboxylase [Epithele typhae]